MVILGTILTTLMQLFKNEVFSKEEAANIAAVWGGDNGTSRFPTAIHFSHCLLLAFQSLPSAMAP